MRIGTIAHWALSIIVGIACASQTWGQTRSIDPVNSKLLVHVSKGGLFSSLGDNHEVEAPISEGFIDEAARRVEFAIESRHLQVLDPHLSKDKRQQVQERMLGPEVLDVVRFPKISFESTAVEQAGPDRLLVRGQLSLHGHTRAVVVTVRTARGSYVGSCTLKQREFGITPISIAGGTVKVKDELTIEFDLRTVSEGTGTRSQ